MNAATPGEWRIRPYHNQQTWVMICADIGGVNDIVIADVQDRTLYPDGANNAEFIAAAPADIRYLLARVRELEAENELLIRDRGKQAGLVQNLIKTVERRAKREASIKTALTPFAEVGAVVAARPAYPHEQELMRVGGATVTFAHLIAAADVLAVRAEAVTGGASGKGGISEHGEKAT